MKKELSNFCLSLSKITFAFTILAAFLKPHHMWLLILGIIFTILMAVVGFMFLKK